eukprot:scaffold8324_cov78-Skeletonema_dohrnii-CCMP3373.AAC.6
MASAVPFLVAILLLQSCIALISPNRCFQQHHDRPVISKCRQPTQIYVVDPTKTTDTDSPSSSPPTQQKRRRRKADSFFLTSSQSTANEPQSEQPAITTYITQKPLEAKQSECPFEFATTFKRYRVNLSNDKNANNDPESEKRRSRRVQRGVINKLVNNLGTKRGDTSVNSSKESGEERKNPWGVVSGIVQGVFQSDSTDTTNRDNSNTKVRKSTEAMYASEVKEGLFRWVSSAEKITESSPFADEDFVAAAAFWRMASDIIVQQQQQQNEMVSYLALPETTAAVASNLCDILNWYADLDTKEDASIHIVAQLDSRSSDVPVIQFTASGNRQQQLNNYSLPSAADTERQTKAWVTRLLVELGVCPFTKSSQKSGQGLGDQGVPVANIMYRHSDALSRGDGGVYLIMADAWEAISDMVAAGPSGKRGVSSILLSAPGFDEDFALWAGPVFAMLEAGVSAIQAEEMIGVVCFHPRYVVPDGKSWPGFGHMHSLPRLKNWYSQYSSISTIPLEDDEIAAGGAFQRRTPHAVINVLRAEQLEAAEGRRSTGELYERNIRVLMGKEGGIGLEKLTDDLRLEQEI